MRAAVRRRGRPRRNPKQPAGEPVSLRGQPSAWRPLRVCPPARLAGQYMYVHALVCVVGTLPSPLSPPINPQMCCVPGYVSGYVWHGHAYAYTRVLSSLLFTRYTLKAPAGLSSTLRQPPDRRMAGARPISQEGGAVSTRRRPCRGMPPCLPPRPRRRSGPPPRRSATPVGLKGSKRQWFTCRSALSGQPWHGFPRA